MGEPYAEQLARKQSEVAQLLAPWPDLHWLPALASPESHFRNKAKLVVGGTVEAPTLGILDREFRGIDLRECGLYEPALTASFPPLAEFIARARLIPFDVPTGRGELKNIIVTAAPHGCLMIRFVLRSTESLPRIRKHLDWLLGELKSAVVVTVNLLPERKAVPEGNEEIVLTAQSALPMPLSGAKLYLRPQSFFQTNTAVAEGLYAQAREWAELAGARRVWDLYCGVGGFALNVAGPGREVLGVEISEQAVESARLAATELEGVTGDSTHPAAGSVRFMTGDANAAARAEGGSPDTLIVNPPRRGIGALTEWIEDSDAQWLIYSSCNAVTLAKDLAAMPSFQPVSARLFDMFPQTAHSETMVLARRVGIMQPFGSPMLLSSPSSKATWHPAV